MKSFERQGLSIEQFAFQFAIVALGVWLAIIVGNWTTEQQQRHRTTETLRMVLSELAGDERELVEIIRNQRHNVRVLYEVAQEANGSGGRDSVMQRLLRTELQANRTWYPRRAAYSMLVNGGYLQHITDPSLRLRLAELYDHDYARSSDNGKLSDDVNQMLRFGLLDFWNFRDDRRMPAQSPAAPLKVANLVFRFTQFSNNYVRLLEHELNAIRATRVAIGKYLE